MSRCASPSSGLGRRPRGRAPRGAAATGEVVAWRDAPRPGRNKLSVGTSDDSAAPPPTARLALAPEHPRVSARAGRWPDTVRLVVIVPFREDGSGRESQLSALLARLRSMFLPGECLVVVAEQADDGRKFNRGQLLSAFAHLRETAASLTCAKRYTASTTATCSPTRRSRRTTSGPPVPAGGRGGAAPAASSSSSSVPAVSSRVLCADGVPVRRGRVLRGRDDLRSAGLRGDERVPERVLGLGGGQRAVPPLRARGGPGARARARLSLRRRSRASRRSRRSWRGSTRRARCGAKEKKQLLRENARSWRMDGLTDVTFESSVPARTAVPTATRVEENAEKTKNEKRKTPVRRFAFRLRAAIADEVACAECGERKGPSGFASHQHKRAMFYAARARKTGSVDRVSGRSDDKTPRDAGARNRFWRERNRVARLCHWDERGGPRRDARPIAPIRPILGARCSANTYEHRFARNSISHHGSPVHGDVKAFVEAVFREARGSVFGVRREGPANVGVSETSRAQRRGRDADDVRALRRALREAEQALRAPQGVAVRRAGREVIEGHVSSRPLLKLSGVGPNENVENV